MIFIHNDRISIYPISKSEFLSIQFNEMKNNNVEKVLMLTLFPHKGNGSSTVVRDLGTLMSKKYNIRIFYVGREEADLVDYQSHFMLVDDFPVLRTHPLSLERRRFIDLSQGEITQYLDKLYQEVLQFVSDFKPDVIHVHHGWLGATVAKRIKEKTGIPFIVQFHGTELEVRSDYHNENSETFAFLENLICEGLENAFSCVAISPTEQTKVSAYLKNANLPPKVLMIPNGYDENIFYPTEKNFDFVKQKFTSQLKNNPLDEVMPIALFAGRFAGFKGIEYLVKAARIFGEKNIQTVLCGNGELYEDMVNLSQDLKVKNIHFLGHVDHYADLPILYNLADVLLVPSRNEPFGLVAIEAMGCGVPMVASDSGALPYILDYPEEEIRDNDYALTPYGIVTPLADCEAIAKAVLYCIENHFKANNRELIKQYTQNTFSIATQSSRYECLYAQAVE